MLTIWNITNVNQNNLTKYNLELFPVSVSIYIHTCMLNRHKIL